MITKIFPVNPFEMNCYVYYDEQIKQGIIIDPAAYSVSEENLIYDFIREEGINIEQIVNTHGHLDHILGNAWARRKFNVPLLMHRDDLPLIEKSGEQAALFGLSFSPPPKPDKFICESDKIEFASTTLDIILAPGHSPGSVCLVDTKEKLIFCGDVIFKDSIGRTDLWMGSLEMLLESIRNKVLSYPDDYAIYPGHYESTTVGYEKLNNPFLN